MTYQETIWKDKIVWVVSMLSKNNRIHRYLRKYVGQGGYVLGEAKDGMLRIEFGSARRRHVRCVPSSCIVEYGKAKNVNVKK